MTPERIQDILEENNFASNNLEVIDIVNQALQERDAEIIQMIEGYKKDINVCCRDWSEFLINKIKSNSLTTKQ